MQIKIESFGYHVRDPNYSKPLFVGCSGGGGHNSAIEGIIAYLKALYKDKIHIFKHLPVLWNEETESLLSAIIEKSITVMHSSVLGGPIQQLLRFTPLPIMPKKEQIDEEIQKLSAKQEKQGTWEFVDMLLYACNNAGYRSVAAWNISQREDKTGDLKNMVGLQSFSDSINYESVYQYFYQKLMKAAEEKQPFTEIISTQAMALPALCDAVIAYNQYPLNKERPKVVIHQYMTDLPTTGAIHFFNPLSQLTAVQQKQIKLYGVGMNYKILGHFFKQTPHFSCVSNVPFQENPMVRPGFTDKTLDNSNKFSEDLKVSVFDTDQEQKLSYDIDANQKIASIMLGSQAGNDTYDYLETLLNNGIDKVFVFGGKTNPELYAKINALIEREPTYRDRLIALANQNDQTMTPIMTRSDVLIIRGGGLSVMEQLAMNHNPNQRVLIHYPDLPSKELTSGISWEDENVRVLMTELKKRGIYSKKTTPLNLKRDLFESEMAIILGKTCPDLSGLTQRSIAYLIENRCADMHLCIIQLLLLDNLLQSLYQKRKQLEAKGNPTVAQRVYEHKSTLIHQAIICLESFMFSTFAENSLKDLSQSKHLLLQAMDHNYLYVHKSGDGMSETEILVTQVLQELTARIDASQSLLEEKEEKTKRACPSTISLFKDSMSLQVSPEEKQDLLAELRAILQVIKDPTNPRTRSQKKMLETAEKYLIIPSLDSYYELFRLRKIYHELNKCAYVFLDNGSNSVNKILALGRAIKQNDQWIMIQDEQENEDMDTEKEEFVLVSPKH